MPNWQIILRKLLTNDPKCDRLFITRLDSDLLGRPRAGCTARHGRFTGEELPLYLPLLTKGCNLGAASYVCLVSFGSLLSKPKNTTTD